MLSPELIVDAINSGRCLRTRVLLMPGERLLSRSAFPNLYSGGSNANEAAFLREIFRAIPSVLRAPDLSFAVRDEVRAFMAMVIRLGGMHKEDYVHRYLFEFWESLWPEPEDVIQLPERYFKGETEDAHTAFARTVLPKIRTTEAITDIVGLGGPLCRTLFLVEVKLTGLDDRTLGQILRYYQLGRAACERYYHDCDIRQVIPVLIIKEAELHFWDAIPQYFRDLLRIYYYRVSDDDRLSLTDGRRILQSLARDRLYA